MNYEVAKSLRKYCLCHVIANYCDIYWNLKKFNYIRPAHFIFLKLLLLHLYSFRYISSWSQFLSHTYV